jgi:molybdenum cofactor cytidylyltransferase
MSVALILLAAGGSTRMGRAKQLLPYRGTTLLRHAATTALASHCHPVVVVVGCQASAMRSELAGLPVQIVENPDWLKGMGTSIRAGVEAISNDPQTASVLVMLCDQPDVTSVALNRIIDRYARDKPPIVASQYFDTLGVPALFDRSTFLDLSHLEHAAGARQVIHRYETLIASIPLITGGADVDTPEDYKRIL